MPNKISSLVVTLLITGGLVLGYSIYTAGYKSGWRAHELQTEKTVDSAKAALKATDEYHRILFDTLDHFPHESWLETKPSKGEATLWGSVMPQKDPLILAQDTYTLKHDIRYIRPTYDNEGTPLLGNVTTKDHTYVKQYGKWLEEQVDQWRAGEEIDFFNFWLSATDYTNYVENIGLTANEAREIAKEARSQAIEKLKEWLQKTIAGDKRKNDPSTFAHWLLLFRLNEEDFNLSKGEVIRLYTEMKQH